VELGQSLDSSWLVEGRRGEVEARYGEPACQCEVAPCTGDRIFIETLGRVRRIIMEKRQRSLFPANDLDSRPRLTPPVHIERSVYTSRNLWKERCFHVRFAVAAKRRHDETTSMSSRLW
jgi:hypothetical protein